MMFKKLQYHVSYNGGEPVVTTNYFTSESVLRECINWWNTKTRQWKYWLTVDDERENSVAVAGDLPVMQGGFSGCGDNYFTFNPGDEFYDYCYNDSFDRTKAPGIIDG